MVIYVENRKGQILLAIFRKIINLTWEGSIKVELLKYLERLIEEQEKGPGVKVKVFHFVKNVTDFV